MCVFRDDEFRYGDTTSFFARRRRHLNVVSEMEKLRSHITPRCVLYKERSLRRSWRVWFWRWGEAILCAVGADGDANPPKEGKWHTQSAHGESTSAHCEMDCEKSTSPLDPGAFSANAIRLLLGGEIATGIPPSIVIRPPGPHGQKYSTSMRNSS